MGRKRAPKGWPTVEGRPALRAELEKVVTQIERWTMIPSVPAPPHFCSGCTAPLEVTPCPVCRKVALERADHLRDLLDRHAEMP